MFGDGGTVPVEELRIHRVVGVMPRPGETERLAGNRGVGNCSVWATGFG